MINSVPRTERISRPPSIVCHGFLDSNGLWNNGFACPITNFIQYFCCGNDEHRYCCPPDRYVFEISSLNEFISSPSTNSNEHFRSTTQRTIVDRQFERFQNYFLPIFLLTTTILFLIGIALWFWLFKHKVFYSIEQNDSSSLPIEHRLSSLSTTEV